MHETNKCLSLPSSNHSSNNPSPWGLLPQTDVVVGAGVALAVTEVNEALAISALHFTTTFPTVVRISISGVAASQQLRHYPNQLLVLTSQPPPPPPSRRGHRWEFTISPMPL